MTNGSKERLYRHEVVVDGLTCQSSGEDGSTTSGKMVEIGMGASEDCCGCVENDERVVGIEHQSGYDRKRGKVQDVDDPSETIVSGRPVVVLVERESALGNAVGREWDKLDVGGQSDKYLNLIRPDADQPCPTVTQLGGTSAASVTHPYERRKFSIAELRRICGFPDDFILTGTYSQQWERLGRAVPPPMMRAIAEALEGVLKP
jgi:site-specific DNA-cytosine methylase